MKAKLNLAFFIIVTALCGVGVVAWETPQNLLLFTVWTTVAVIRFGRLRESRGNYAISVGLLHATVMALIVTAATFAPVKRIDVVLQQSVQLESKDMTVAELSEYCRFNRRSLPLSIYVPAKGDAVTYKLSFSSKQLSLQQFIREVEQQTGCKHRFGGCGNAYSILYGSAYNFGLSFAPTSDSDFRWR